MQDYINLINFLKENDESVRKDLETLKFGTKVKYGNTENVEHFYIGNGDFGGKLLWLKTNVEGYTNCTVELEEDETFDIIGNNLDYHHIMMYCKSKGIFFSVNGVGEIMLDVKYYIQLDNTKPFHEQDDLVYKQLLDYFIGLQ